MKILSVHNIKEAYFDLDLENFRLTFDDGLYSQFYYFPLLKKSGSEMIFFIITSFAKPGKVRKMFDGEPYAYVKSSKYMHDALIKDDFGHFMTLEEIRTLSGHKQVLIGAHSHFHDGIIENIPPKKPSSQWKLERYPCLRLMDAKKWSIRSRLACRGFNCRDEVLVRRSEQQWMDYIKFDTELCLKWFESNLGFTPTAYCFPFNEYDDKLIRVLKSFGFSMFFNGSSAGNRDVFTRTDIDVKLRESGIGS
jgi:peptidoglycan/xylan/chitin deacetylase (PgdA/CDA1 family)